MPKFQFMIYIFLIKLIKKFKWPPKNYEILLKRKCIKIVFLFSKMILKILVFQSSYHYL